MTHDERIVLYDEITKGKLGDNVKDYLLQIGFFDAPASTKFHGAYEGGLFQHSYLVAENLLRLTRDNDLQWQRDQHLSPVVVGLFHDLCKCDQYIIGEDGKIHWNEDTELKGHGEKSVVLAKRIMPLTVEEELCIRYHMGAFTEKKEWGHFTNSVQMCSNVLWTHMADMIASRIQGV